MSDFISKSALIETLDYHGMLSLQSDIVPGIERVGDIVGHFPTINVAPVIHAKWIYTGEMDEDGNCEANCSHCGAGDKHRADLKDAVPYCWKCGARMDGEADG